MADTRIQMPIKIVDPTTSSQEAGVDSSGQLKVIEPSAAGALTALQLIDDVIVADDAAFTPGTTKVAMIGAEFDNTGTDSVDEGDAGALRMSGNRNLYVNIRDNAGNERGLNIDANGALNVGDVIPGTAAANLGKAEDAAHTSGDVGIMLLGVRNDSNATAFSGTDGDYTPLAVDAQGNLQVDVLSGGGVDTPTNPARAQLTSSALAAGSSANLDSADLPSKYAWQIDIAASVAWKAVISLNDNGSLTTLTTLFGRSGESKEWRPPHRAFAQAPAAGTGTQGWRIAMTNLDTSEAADVYACIHYADN